MQGCDSPVVLVALEGIRKMSNYLNRRQFFKNSLVSSVAGALVSAKVSAEAPLGAGLPNGKIGNVKISRLIIGGNQFSGWSHSRDLKYLRELFLAYSSEEKIMDTLEACEEAGINAIITSSSGYLSK